ncbi:MAG: hypothetical protein AMK75_02245, partial [Planctomycetes bacterium SM23_65]
GNRDPREMVIAPSIGPGYRSRLTGRPGPSKDHQTQAFQPLRREIRVAEAPNRCPESPDGTWAQMSPLVSCRAVLGPFSAYEAPEALRRANSPEISPQGFEEWGIIK